MQKHVDDSLTDALKTVIELDFIKSLIQSLIDTGGAITKLNDTIGMMEKARINTTDVHTWLWSLVGHVIRGGSLVSAP